MSLLLDMGTKPEGTVAQALPNGQTFLGPLTITMDDFCSLVMYVLTNTDLKDEADPRLHLVDQIRELHVIRGYNEGSWRLGQVENPGKIVT